MKDAKCGCRKVVIYQSLVRDKRKNWFGIIPSDGILFKNPFSVEESNRIIQNVVNHIKVYEKNKRKINLVYHNTADREGLRISKVEMESNDGIIKGNVSYDPSYSSIKISLNFNSKEMSFLEEYNGLAKIVGNM
jgi:hypothetical protein